MYYLGNVPNSNCEFEDIEAMLAKLNVEYTMIDVYKKSPKVFTRVYRISEEEATKLPHEDNKPWLPVEETSGHRLSPDRKGNLWRHYIDRQYSMDWLTPDEFIKGANRILVGTGLLELININTLPIDIEGRVAENSLGCFKTCLKTAIHLTQDESEHRKYREMIEFISST